MWSIVKKELKQYFDHPTAYILLVVFLVVNSFFYFRGILVQNIADLRPMFEFLPWLLLFFIPAITMRMVAEERRVGTLELELVQPIQPWKVLVGKLMASMLFVTVGLALTILIPVMLSSGGSFDVGQVVAQYIALDFLVMSLASIGILASSFTKSQAVSFISALGIGFFFIMAGTEIVTVEFTGTVRTILAQLSLLSHYRNMVRGVLDVRDILYFVTFSLSFISISYILLVRPLVNPKRREYRQLKGGVMGIVIISLLLNILGAGIPGRLDLTKGNIYTLAPATKQALMELDDIVTIKVFESENLPPQIALTQRDVRDMVRDFERVSGNNVRAEFVVAGEGSDALQEAQSLGIVPVQFNVVSKQELSVKQGFFGLSVLYAGEHETIPFVDNTSGLEYQLITFIRKLTAIERQTVGFVVGHGEKAISADLSTFAGVLREQYDVTSIDLASDDMSDVDVVVVAGPTSEIPLNEQTVLRNFLAAGGSVLFLVDQIDISLQTLQATPNTSSIASLIEEYGVRINTDIVFDVRSNESVTFGGGFVSYVLPYPLWPRIPAVEENPIAGDVPHIVMPWASSLDVVSDEHDVISLFETTEFAGAQVGQFNLAPDQRISVSDSDLAKRLMAVAVNLANADDTNNDQSDIPAGRLVVVGDSDFLTEQFVRSGGSSNNLVFGINTIDWLSQDEALIGIRSKNRQPASLVFENEGTMARIRLVNLIGVPALVVLYGAFHLYRRKKKSNQVLTV